MANFFKESAIDMRNPSDRGFRDYPSCQTRTRSVLSQLGNITRATNNVVSLYSNDVSVDPIAKEIVNRLEVVTRIVPPEEVQQISQEFINRLNNICYEKIAEQVRGAPIVNGFTNAHSSAASTRGRKPASSNAFIPNNGMCREQDATSRIFNATKQMQKDKHLITMNEMANDGLMVPSNRDNSKRMTKPMKIISSYTQNDVSRVSQKPVSSARSKALPQSLTFEPKVQRKRRNDNYDEEDSIASAELTITKNSLRSNGRPKAVATKKNRETSVSRARSKPKTKTAAKQQCKGTTEVLSFFSEEDSIVDVCVQMEKIKHLPKKTALSPFFDRLQKRSTINSSTPMKEMC